MSIQESLRWVSFVGSALSVLLGVSYIIYGFTVIRFAPRDCSFFYCNDQWRMLITFAPERFIDTFQPIIMGGIGVLYALPTGFRPEYPASLSPPSSSALGGVFHIVMALFTNLGYMYWVGIVIAAVNLLIGVTFVVINLRSGATRPKDVDEVTPSTGNSVPTTQMGMMQPPSIQV
jgi:hypothetical protein